MNSIEQLIREIMSAIADKLQKVQAKKNPLVGSGLLGLPGLHRYWNRNGLIMTVNTKGVQWGGAC
ncbi:hypothetical protein [Endozoicomonas ascidiicola]|uniref:hypothetical protein n=1 Tax=Endozoicomonas ascidiicola TaxID=1698521 RepID=UPI000835EA01|nr:hypothetical protein [Endozoicomonas ascidiicola]